MSVQILEGKTHACLFCNTTDWAFGPLFDDAEQARRFLRWLPEIPDPRRYNDKELEELHFEFTKGEAI